MNQPVNNQTRVISDPEVRHDSDEEGNPVDPSVGWDLSFGCTLTVGVTGDQLAITINTSDQDQRDGITHRALAREQVADYARKLLALIGEPMLERQATIAAERDSWQQQAIEHNKRADALQAQFDAAPYSTGYPVGDKVAARIAEYRERAEKAQAERNELIGFACEGSSACPSPLHVDGCFRSDARSSNGRRA